MRTWNRVLENRKQQQMHQYTDIFAKRKRSHETIGQEANNKKMLRIKKTPAPEMKI